MRGIIVHKCIVAVVFAVLILSTLSMAHTKHAPLPASLLSAHTLFIDNQSGSADLTDKCYDELNKWGRFKIVDDEKQADVIFRISIQTQTRQYVGSVDNNGNVEMTASHAHYTTVSVLSPSGQLLWADTRRWGLFNSAERKVIEELRDRIEGK